ncbi:hypothetical protein FLX56_25680 [Synechococcus moorigangaii CMS01]|nr:hypothetical protein [Synechococcus moorigangaii CMS01]
MPILPNPNPFEVAQLNQYTNTGIPKRIWMLWYQGLDKAPFLVQRCIQRWKDLNPDWEIIILDLSLIHI